MNIEEIILKILGEHKALKTKEIADIISSRYGLNVNKSEINSLLYGKLKDKAEQNNNYQWSQKKVGTINRKIPAQEVNKENTSLSQLAYYYLECVSKDMDKGISVFASSKYNPDYTQINSFPFETNNEDKISKHLLEKVRRDKNNYVFKLGYPLLIRSFVAKDSRIYFMAEPLFIFSIDTENALYSGTINLSDDDPVFNPKALESITGIDPSSELLLEIVDLYEDLGINNDTEDKPGLDDLFQRLQQIRSDWNWKENIDVSKLSIHDIASISDIGIYNLAAVFVTEKSKYTAGLEKDLKDLSKLPESDYVTSALGAWIKNSVDLTPVNDKVLIEPIPLNEEQREAIQRGLSSQLTVVTGPPGTGKSQVVTSLIVNAVYQGQTVLFSSKNNKAVDVVNERVNALSNRQIMLRLGSKFQYTLSEYLSGLLSARPSKHDESRYTEAGDIHQQLIEGIEIIRKKEEHVVELRNEVDKKEKNLEQAREELGTEFFAACKSFPSDDLTNLSLIINPTRVKLNKANKIKQPFLLRLFWSFIKKQRFEDVQKNFDSIIQCLGSLDHSKPTVLLDDSHIGIYEEYLDTVIFKTAKVKEIKEYFNSLEALNKQDDLFQLSLNEKDLSDKVINNSLELWNYWLQLLPNRISQNDRKVIGDYIAVLNLIIAAEGTGNQIDRGVWSKYYSFLPQIIHILPCWAVTSLSARGRVPLKAGFFDLVVIDEASQCDIASALPLLYRAKRAVIIGDDKQLTHISSISEIQDIHLLEKYELDRSFMGWSYAATSLFRLASSQSKAENIIVLRDHHRSHADIINYSNRYFYENTLRVATKYEKLKSIPNEPAVRWIDIKGKCLRLETGSSYNDKEAEEVVKELARLVSCGYKGTIGVVTPFRAQHLRILDRINMDKDLFDRLISRDFLCDTVHKFQGDEKDLIIFSPVVSDGMNNGALSFLKRTGNLFNVAITRARAVLIVVGDNQASFKSGIPHYKGFVEYVQNLKEFSTNPIEKNTEDLGPKYPKVNTKATISDWEKMFYETLYKEGIHTIPQYGVGQYSLDLVLFDGKRKLNIEIDGEKYHRNWDGELIRRDQLRNRRLIELGWDVQRFWVYQIRDNMSLCVEKVKLWKEKK